MLLTERDNLGKQKAKELLVPSRLLKVNNPLSSFVFLPRKQTMEEDGKHEKVEKDRVPEKKKKKNCVINR